jgi:hypothetical protein
MKENAQAELVKLHAKLGLAAPSSLLQEEDPTDPEDDYAKIIRDSGRNPFFEEDSNEAEEEGQLAQKWEAKPTTTAPPADADTDPDVPVVPDMDIHDIPDKASGNPFYNGNPAVPRFRDQDQAKLEAETDEQAEEGQEEDAQKRDEYIEEHPWWGSDKRLGSPGGSSSPYDGLRISKEGKLVPKVTDEDTPEPPCLDTPKSQGGSSKCTGVDVEKGAVKCEDMQTLAAKGGCAARCNPAELRQVAQFLSPGVDLDHLCPSLFAATPTQEAEAEVAIDDPPDNTKPASTYVPWWQHHASTMAKHKAGRAVKHPSHRKLVTKKKLQQTPLTKEQKEMQALDGAWEKTRNQLNSVVKADKEITKEIEKHDADDDDAARPDDDGKKKMKARHGKRHGKQHQHGQLRKAHH